MGMCFRAESPGLVRAARGRPRPTASQGDDPQPVSGADLGPAINAATTNEFVDANGQIVRDVDTNNFPVRAKGLAQEILSKRPDLVGLQEVALWRYGPVNDAAPFTLHRRAG